MINAKAVEFSKLADEYGFAEIFSVLGNNIKVRIPVSQSFCEQSVDILELSVRSKNGLMRNDSKTIGDIINLIMSEKGLGSVRNLGKKSETEIKTVMLVLAYEQLSEKERVEFWDYVVTANFN